ncbi:MAG: hypothetical protein HYY95_03065 [Candidatus Rokubacteria bacterium]|nr:hypothetical protein [Candidatus Rokubacteria bacterium]
MNTLARVRPRDHEIATGLLFHELAPGRATYQWDGAIPWCIYRHPDPVIPGCRLLDEIARTEVHTLEARQRDRGDGSSCPSPRRSHAAE